MKNLDLYKLWAIIQLIMKIVKISKKYQNEISEVKKLLNKHRVEEDKIVAKLLKSMKLKDDDEEEIVWDHIYNDTDWCVEYTKE